MTQDHEAPAPLPDDKLVQSLIKQFSAHQNDVLTDPAQAREFLAVFTAQVAAMDAPSLELQEFLATTASDTLLTFAHTTYDSGNRYAAETGVTFAQAALNFQNREFSDTAISYMAKLNIHYPGDISDTHIQTFNDQFITSSDIQQRVAKQMRQHAHDKIGQIHDIMPNDDSQFYNTYKKSLVLDPASHDDVAQGMLDHALQSFTHAQSLGVYPHINAFEFLQDRHLVATDTLLPKLKEVFHSLRQASVALKDAPIADKLYDLQLIHQSLDGVGLYIALKEPAFLQEQEAYFVDANQTPSKFGYSLATLFDSPRDDYAHWQVPLDTATQIALQQHASPILAKAAQQALLPGWAVKNAERAIAFDNTQTEQSRLMIDFIANAPKISDSKKQDTLLNLMTGNFITHDQIPNHLRNDSAPDQANKAPNWLNDYRH